MIEHFVNRVNTILGWVYPTKEGHTALVEYEDKDNVCIKTTIPKSIALLESTSFIHGEDISQIRTNREICQKLDKFFNYETNFEELLEETDPEFWAP